jgi:hypothetical protein
MPRKAKKPVTARVRHPFLYRLENGDGTSKVRKAWAIVKYATKDVPLTLTAPHLRRSIKAQGAGTTSHCAVAICTYNHSDAFPHNVEGHIDFNYTRAFVVSKVDKHGLPSHCVVYEHEARNIAKLNDTPGGQQKLLERVERDGPITLTLKAHRTRSEAGRKGSAVGRKKSGVRDPATKGLRGAKLRYTVYKLGSQPE